MWRQRQSYAGTVKRGVVGYKCSPRESRRSRGVGFGNYRPRVVHDDAHGMREHCKLGSGGGFLVEIRRVKRLRSQEGVAEWIARKINYEALSQT